MRLLKISVLTLTAFTCAFGMTTHADEEADPHAHHHPMDIQVHVSTATYNLPAVNVVREDGKKVAFLDELNDGRAVVLNFIYTTCSGICPISSEVFSQFQTKLGDEISKVHIISISIDPEQDTPARLREYASRYHAGAQWNHYTGSMDASLQIQQAFNVYRGDKMSHDPVTLLRAAPGKPWLRLDGFASAEDLLTNYRNLVNKH
ncbi:MAG: SCO family protein [Gammaproteobacteria bacterium]|nr:SCO family protein [Gammaproteobacteria bacterium]